METPAAGGEPRTRGLLGTPKAETPQPQGWLWGILGQPGTPAPETIQRQKILKDLYGEEKPEKTTGRFLNPRKFLTSGGKKQLGT